REARKVWKDADAAIAPAQAVCDILTAARIEGAPLPFDFTRWEEEKDYVFGGKEHTAALGILKGMNPLHFPCAFPEVFLREREGFDVILGNPPWEEAMADEDAFWARYFPGLRAFPARDKKQAIVQLSHERPDLAAVLTTEVADASKMRKTLNRGPFPGMGTGDADLYKAFCWRFWFLAAEAGGRIGVVLPRSVLAAKGSEEFRWTLFKEADLADLTILLNKSRWAFDMEPRYTVALVTIQRGSSLETEVRLTGPYNSRSAYESRREHGGASFSGEEIMSWTKPASLPLLPAPQSGEVFSQLRKSPSLNLDDADQWRARPHRELDATNDAALMDFDSKECPEGFWVIYKGSSFDIWEPDTGDYYAWGDPELLTRSL
ncbi:MAG: hypothetical protein QF745_01760, partial [Planctomycetota bacterium]|nr:hypothetical protein [Planctomycetota bacterium]